MPAPRIVKSLTDMQIDEISLVDRGANQHAAVAIAKRAPEEDHSMDPDLYLEDGTVLTDELAKPGLTVFDEEGNEYELQPEDPEGGNGNEGEGEGAPEPEKELASVGKRDDRPNPFQRAQARQVTKSFSSEVLENISKAFSDEDRDKIIAKALDDLAAENAENAKIAKAERDLRLTREYISKAEEYNLPIAADELGPVMYRMAETMSYDDCAVIAKALEAASEATSQLFDEIGQQGGGANSDVMAMVDAHADAFISKAEGEDFSKAATIAGIFDQTPEAYEQYLADQRSALRG